MTAAAHGIDDNPALQSRVFESAKHLRHLAAKYRQKMHRTF